MLTLTRAEWTARAEAHRERASRRLAGVLERRRRGERHPIEDFLFDYYRLRPGQLIEWHPGMGIALQDAAEIAAVRFHHEVNGVAQVDVASVLAKRAKTVHFTHALLRAVDARPASFTCFGMHEWAMVHRLQPDQVRHVGLPLRFDVDTTAEIAEQVGMRCSHFDAFRFFTPTAAPLNARQLTRADQIDCDQSGCLHVNMDLYKYAGKLAPLVGSELLFDCFELASDIRELDMRASAYDVTGWGLETVPVETASGRAQYVAEQRAFAERARPLRRRLLEITSALTTPPTEPSAA